MAAYAVSVRVCQVGHFMTARYDGAVTDTSAAPGLRDITRRAVRDRIAAVAIARFDADGFENVTVEQIAAEVGISARSFHRYFPAKEDAVIGDVARHRDEVARAFRDQPVDVTAWTALRGAFVAMVRRGADDAETARRSIRVMTSTASLRARNLEKHLSWAEALTPLVAERIGGPAAELRARTLVQAALGCFDVAIAEWSTGQDPDAVAVLQRTFDVLRQAD